LPGLIPGSSPGTGSDNPFHWRFRRNGMDARIKSGHDEK
jgi:hypothetical protein